MKLNLNINFHFSDIKIVVPGIITTTILLSFFFARTGNAANFQVSGKIFDNAGLPVMNASIDVMRTDRGIIVAHSKSDADGSYDLIVSEGTYTIKITQDKHSDPQSVTLTQTVLRDITLNIVFASDTSYSGQHFYNIITNPFYK